MNKELKAFHITIIFLLLTVVTQLIVPAVRILNLCVEGLRCNFVQNFFLDPLAIIFFAITLSAIVHIFSAKSIYMCWKKVTGVSVILLFLVFLLSPTQPSTTSIPLGLVRDEAVLFVSIVYILISWSIALWGWFRKGK